jgi:hypothetical protein
MRRSPHAMHSANATTHEHKISSRPRRRRKEEAENAAVRERVAEDQAQRAQSR